jgi:hypothetical protein
MTGVKRRLLIGLVGAAVVLGLPDRACAQQKKEPDRVGRIIIEGNVDTPDAFILHFLNLYPGQVLSYPNVEAARIRLARTGLFDPETPPTVEVKANELDSSFKDIRVRVQERPGSWAIFTAYDGLAFVLTLDPNHLGEAVERVWTKLSR